MQSHPVSPPPMTSTSRPLADMGRWSMESPCCFCCQVCRNVIAKWIPSRLRFSMGRSLVEGSDYIFLGTILINSFLDDVSPWPGGPHTQEEDVMLCLEVCRADILPYGHTGPEGLVQGRSAKVGYLKVTPSSASRSTLLCTTFLLSFMVGIPYMSRPPTWGSRSRSRRLLLEAYRFSRLISVICLKIFKVKNILIF